MLANQACDFGLQEQHSARADGPPSWGEGCLMKRTGTLKVEIIKPINRKWDECGERMRATSQALAPALNTTMRLLFVQAQAQIDAKRTGDNPDTTWQADARRTLRETWASELARRFDYESSESKRGRRKHEPQASSYLPIESATAGETVNLLLLSRFAGSHLKDLLACRASIPSWSGQQAIYTEGRACLISGGADAARLRLPLWGTGVAKSEEFVVAPAGGHARALWRRLVRDFARRDDLVAAERAIKEARKRAAQLRKAEDSEGARLAEEDALRRELELEADRAIKLGRVGWKYNSRKNKWFALLSWTEYVPSATAQGTQTAAVNYGANVFAQALAEDGTPWADPGADIRVARARFGARRRSIQRALRSLGRGSRGHGKKRRYLPLTKLEDAERRWTQSRIRTHAANLIDWCKRHGVTRLLLHDLSGQREAFERKTGEDAPEQIKRYIHSWPWYEARLAVERQAEEFGIVVELRVGTAKDSTTCPECNHEAPENVTLIDRGGETKLVDGRVFREVSRETRFRCEACSAKGQGDVVTCANMLIAAKLKNPLGKMQEKARKRTKSDLKTLKRGKKAA